MLLRQWLPALIPLVAGFVQLHTEHMGLFYDFDCTEAKEVLSWNTLYNVTGQLNTSTTEPFWGKVNLTWAGWVFGTDEMQKKAEQECPIGVLMLAILQFYMSAHAGDQELASYWRDFVQHSIAAIPWYYTALSRWPIFELIHYYQPMMGVDKERLEKGCCPQRNGYLDWRELLGLGITFAEGAEKGMVDEVVASALGQATEYLFTLGNERIDEAVEECLCGVVFLTIVQSTTSGNRLTQYFEKWSAVATDFLDSLPLAMYGATDWPIMQALMHFGDLGKGNKFHEYANASAKMKRRYSDLRPSFARALLPLGDRSSKLIDEMPFQEKDALLRDHENTIVGTMFKAADSVASSWSTTDGISTRERVVPFTTVYGTAWMDLLQRSIRWVTSSPIGIPAVLVASLGEPAHSECRALMSVLSGLVCWEVPYSESQIHRYTVAQMLIHMGFDAFYFDLDTFFVQNPLPRIMEYLASPATHGTRKSKDTPLMLWSTHVDGRCINVGIFYMVSSTATGEWSTTYLNWLHRHSYEIDQRGVNALLNYTTTIHVSFEPASIVTGEGIPPYSTLDDLNEFISPDGWVGKLASVYIVHFIAVPMAQKIGNLTALYDAVENTSDMIHATLQVADLISAFRVPHAPQRDDCW
ncbi:hypothetical protein FOZ61_001388 [Perkinsus olseni]|uniref:Nucleotide-diphospho-sugar transferase domain-containing protein n=1 Tax=Perkinsus olseni TaxID=32597 RepID=A0A7J6LX65_PEROL|nr:hypothetical protein FOZ61_001388 [Perkinsus olseni]KAF4667101.1 hypothetical protein FOL46_002687 [Perkinsus olseni]